MRARRDYTIEDYGHPCRQFSLGGEAVEVRAWLAPPPPGVAAIRHPSGVWLAIRLDSR